MNLINILLRVTFRPKYFEECIQSILNQTYKNFNIICCYDDKLCLKYLEKYKDKINYYFINIDSNEKLKYNLYPNDLLKKVNDGYIIFLDDDDKFYSKYSLETISQYLTNENNIIFWKFKLSDKSIYPKNIKNIKAGEIANSSYCFHSKFKNLSKWDSTQTGDFNFLNKMLKKKEFTRFFLDYDLTGTIWFDLYKHGSSGKKFYNLEFEDFYYYYYINDIPSNYFDVKYYLEQYNDLQYLKNSNKNLDLFEHWNNFGKRELRICSKKYKEIYLEKLSIAIEKFESINS